LYYKYIKFLVFQWYYFISITVRKKETWDFSEVSATWCLVIVRHTEKLNRFQRDDRPHNSIPLDEMTDGRVKPPSTHTQAYQVSSCTREAQRNSCPWSCKCWGLETQLLCWEGFKEL